MTRRTRKSVRHQFFYSPNGYATMFVTMPDTITTWIMQAVAINNETGLGLATPLRIVSRKDFFVSLKMPYSVKRGEQISLLVTAFNYGKEKLKVYPESFTCDGKVMLRMA